MAISVTDPISRAIAHAKRMTFQPFDLGGWFIIGFCAFLASLAEGGANFNTNFANWGGGSPKKPGTPVQFGVGDITGWISTHHTQVAVIAAALVLLMLLIALVVLWISSRGVFMFLDCIAKNQAAVVEPWKRLRRLGNSYFRFRILMSVIGFLVMLAIAGIALALAWPDIQNKTFGHSAIMAIVVGVLLLLPSMLIIGIIDWCGRSLVTVIMYARDLTVAAAWREFRQTVVRGNVGNLTLFLLMYIVLSIAVALGQNFLGCVTLCIGLLPYLSSVVALPLLIFLRAYAVYFVQQFDPRYVIIQEPGPTDFGFQVIMPTPPPLPPPLPHG